MPTLDMLTLTGTVLGPNGAGLAKPGTNVVCTVLSAPGYALEAQSVTFYVDSDGELKTATTSGQVAQLPQGSRVLIRGGVRGFTKGAEVDIPEVAEYEFRLLIPATSPSSTAVSQAALNALTERVETLEESAGAFELTVLEIDEDATLDMGTAARALVLLDTSAGDVTVILPPAGDVEGREVLAKKKADDNLGILDGDGTETIDGQLVFNLELNNQSVRLVAAGGEWHIL